MSFLVYKGHIQGNRCLICLFHYYSAIDYLISCSNSFPETHLYIGNLLVHRLLHPIQQYSQTDLASMADQ